MDLTGSLDIASSGLTAQSTRLNLISQNIANADSMATTAGGDPYQRKTITFKSVLDKKLGLEKVEVAKIGKDKSEFGRKYDPSNPAADADGYIKTPNVNTILETMDAREARASYQANLTVIEITKGMIARTLELLRV